MLRKVDCMPGIYKSIDELVGKTPLMELTRMEKEFNLSAKIFAKLEYFNPAGSIKDRVAQAIVSDAEDKGLITPGATLIEPTSGNTGIGLALIAAIKGYKLILTMPETMSIERRRLAEAYGARVVLTEGAKGMQGSIEKANELAEQIENSFIPGQFVNPANPMAHYNTTGPEIYSDTKGTIDIFVAGVGTGGTITGCGKYLKEKNPDIKVVAIEPKGYAVLSGGAAGPHKLQGIGAGFIPEVLDTKVYDEVVAVSDEDAIDMKQSICKTEGLLVGISSGAALCAALEVAKRKENTGKNIVVILPDTGERYLSV